MGHPPKEPIWQIIIKGLAAALLVLVALVFGAGGACGVLFAGSGLWDAVSRRGTRLDGDEAFAAVCAVVGLGVAAVAVLGVVLMFRKQSGQED